MDERTYCLTRRSGVTPKACLTLAKRWGLIGDDSPEALERRRAAKNAQAEKAEQDGKPRVRHAALLCPCLPAI